MRRIALPGFAAIIAFAILMVLGTWQVQRLHWKEGLLAKIEERIAADPMTSVQVVEALRSGEDIEYLRVQVTGTYDHRSEIYMYQVGPQGPGWHVYTPLDLETGGAVMINRGFVSLAQREAETRPESLLEGPVTVTGLARGQANKGLFGNENNPATNEWYWRDVPAMLSYSDIYDGLPFVIDAEKDGDPGDLPIDGTTIISLPNNHFGYALTWYGLGGTLVLVAIPFLWRRARKTED